MVDILKWLVVAGILGIAPFLAQWLRQNAWAIRYAFVLLGTTPFLLSSFGHVQFAVISWSTWWGYTQGIEVSVIDVVAVTLLLTLPRPARSLPMSFAFALYLVAVLLSLFQSEAWVASSFYAWQVARMYLLFVVIARGCAADPRNFQAVLTGMALGIGLQFVVALHQRFALGIIQVSGTFFHQNTLGMVDHFVTLPFFALLLSGKGGWRPYIVVLMGTLVAALTASRATIGLAALGLCFMYSVSLVRHVTARKLLVGLMGSVVAVAVFSVAAGSLQKRFSVQQIDSEYDERLAFNNAAIAIVDDYPLGIGANNYVHISKSKGYSQQAGVARGNWNSHVHNVYLLAAAETGYLGAAALVLLMVQPMLYAFVYGWRRRSDGLDDLVLGLGTAILMVSLHSFYEWILVTAQVQYMLTMSIAMISASILLFRSTEAIHASPRRSLSLPPAAYPAGSVR